MESNDLNFAYNKSVRGYIDAGSLSGAVAAFHFNEPKEIYSWAWQNVLEVTSVLIGTRHIWISPEPNPIRPPMEPFGPVYKEFSQVLDIVKPPTKILSSAYQITKEIVRKSQNKIKDIYLNHQNDHKGFGNWLDWVISNSWSNHAARKGGVCDNVFLPEVSNIIDISIDELNEIQKFSTCPIKIKKIASTQIPYYMYETLIDSFVISAIIRGVYYACVAHETSSQLLCHQIRDALFSTSSSNNSIDYRVSNTELYLATIIAASVFREMSHKQRIKEWSNLIIKARQVVYENKIEFQHTKSDDAGLNEAIRIAKLLGIRTNSKWIDKGINACSAIGIGILTSFILTPWEGFIVGLTSGTIMEKSKLGDKTSSLFENDYWLKNLAVAAPGNISRNWMGSYNIDINKKNNPPLIK